MRVAEVASVAAASDGISPAIYGVRRGRSCRRRNKPLLAGEGVVTAEEVDAIDKLVSDVGDRGSEVAGEGGSSFAISSIRGLRLGKKAALMSPMPTKKSSLQIC